MKRRIAVILVVLSAVVCGAWAQDTAIPRFPDVKIMIVVPEFHKGQFGLLDETLLGHVRWTIEGYYAAQPAVESRLIKHFVDANYRVIDQNQYAANRYSPDMEAVVNNPSGPQARSLTANSGADILIVGKAMAETAGAVGTTAPVAGVAKPISVRTAVTLRAVSTHGDAQIIGATDATGSGADVSAEAGGLIASRKAGDIAARYLLQRIGNAVGGPTSNEALDQAVATSGKTRIAVMPFEDRSRWDVQAWNLTVAIPDLIANELMKVSSYEIVDRANLNEIVQNQGLQQSGLFDAGGQAEELGTLAKADIGIFGRITDFSTKKTGGLIVIPGTFGGGLGMEKAVVRVLIKVVDLKTGVVLATNEAKADSTSAIIGGGYTGILFGGGQFDKSAAGKATRECITKAVKIVLEAMPTVCPGCGAKITGTDKFCPECGAEINAAPPTCPACQAPVKPGDKFCRQCGQRLGQ
jgi:curli biogenesis system outer membrane secretion channel CsgG